MIAVGNNNYIFVKEFIRSKQGVWDSIDQAHAEVSEGFDFSVRSEDHWLDPAIAWSSGPPVLPHFILHFDTETFRYIEKILC